MLLVFLPIIRLPGNCSPTSNPNLFYLLSLIESYLVWHHLNHTLFFHLHYVLSICGQEKHCSVVSYDFSPLPPQQFHYICFGQGFQTWEYSPAYALRSYGYLLLHIIPMQLVQAGNKVHTVLVNLPHQIDHV